MQERAKQVSKGLIDDIKEARDPIFADLLRLMSKLAIRETSTFSHLFSLLWNLIARGDNVCKYVNAFHLGHISWSGNKFMECFHYMNNMCFMKVIA